METFCPTQNNSAANDARAANDSYDMPEACSTQDAFAVKNVYPMKDVYVNPALAALLIRHRVRPRERIFSCGEAWRLLTPARLAGIAGALGQADPRVRKLLGIIRRHAPHPEAHCRRLGIAEVRYVPPGAYAPALCPRCDRPHHPHPLDAAVPCPDCREAALLLREHRASRAERDRRLDAAARERLLGKHPDAFDDGQLSPNWKYNKSRVLRRDWDTAVKRILMGLTYRETAREFGCSVGLLHKRARERMAWENN